MIWLDSEGCSAEEKPCSSAGKAEARSRASGDDEADMSVGERRLGVDASANERLE